MGQVSVIRCLAFFFFFCFFGIGATIRTCREIQFLPHAGLLLSKLFFIVENRPYQCFNPPFAKPWPFSYTTPYITTTSDIMV